MLNYQKALGLEPKLAEAKMKIGIIYLTQNNRESLRKNVENLQALRSQATQDVWPIIDLGIATDNVVMARLEERTNHAAESTAHRQAAASLLRSLGWKDVSDSTLDDLADKRLKKRPSK